MLARFTFADNITIFVSNDNLRRRVAMNYFEIAIVVYVNNFNMPDISIGFFP